MTEKRIRPFGLRDKLGYLFGDFGNDFTFILSTMVLMKFYTDVMGVSAAVVGGVMMVSRMFDAVTDITMGRICDRSPVRRGGKFKPWILRMCIPVALSSFLIYQSSLSELAMPLKIAYLALTYILWGSVFYTAVNIPYGSMASAISAEPHHRQSLSTFRTMGGMLAGMIIGVAVPLFAYEKQDGREVLVGGKVTLLAGVFSLLTVVCYLLCYYLVNERVRVEHRDDFFRDHTVLDMLRGAFKNRALVSIIAASVLMLLAQLTMQSMANYVYPDYYASKVAQSASTLLMVGGMSVAAVFAGVLSRRYGKAEISVVANLFAALICFILFLIRPENVWVYVGFQFLCWLGLGFFSMVNWSLITDVIDYSELKNGVREDGSIYALYSFARKLGQAAAAGISGALLTLIGYDEGAAMRAEAQSEGVLSGIFDISTLVPGIGFLFLGLVLWFWYPLHKKQVEENVRRLKERR